MIRISSTHMCRALLQQGRLQWLCTCFWRNAGALRLHIQLYGQVPAALEALQEPQRTANA